MLPHGGKPDTHENDPVLLVDGRKLQFTTCTPRRLQMLPLQYVTANAKLRLIVRERDQFVFSARIALQAYLKECGLYLGPIDGKFTEDARDPFGNWRVRWFKNRLNPAWKATRALQQLVGSPEFPQRVPGRDEEGVPCVFGGTHSPTSHLSPTPLRPPHCSTAEKPSRMRTRFGRAAICQEASGVGQRPGASA
eukprot:3445499-Prymnesium_polylepis.2